PTGSKHCRLFVQAVADASSPSLLRSRKRDRAWFVGDQLSSFFSRPMNIKIIGVGKCGSRICYDFFAHISGLPSAYEIRIQPNASAISKLFESFQAGIGFKERMASWRREWQYLTGTELLKDTAWYAIVDSDVANNEITQSVVFFTKSDGLQEETVF